jgi:hypothetical protein
MKRIISVLVAALMIFGVFAGNINANTASASASPENQHATFLAVRWHAVGNDKFGDPLEGGRSFPWQNPGEPEEAYWGRTGYMMPNALTAINRDGSARTVTTNNSRLGTSPMLWTEIFLTVIADNGNSKFITNEGGDFAKLGRWYAIMDTAGQVWFDPDGNFHDSRYLASADPASPAYVYSTGTSNQYTTDATPYGSCLYNPLAKVDPFEGNNTQGPYAFSPKDSDGNVNPNYIEPCYFWVRPTLTNEINSVEGNNTCNAYLNHTLKGESRVWQLGIASRPDYYAMGRTSPLGNTFDGVVRTGEWDVGLNVYAFDTVEVWVDAPLPIPWGPGGGSGTFTPGDFVYRDLTPGPMTVDPNDVRLTNIIVGIPPNTTMYIAGTVVQPGDLDVGVTINNFPANFRYAKKDLSKTKTTYPIQARAIHQPLGQGYWSDISPAGTSFVPVQDVSKFSIGASVRIGPNNLGQFQQCRVTDIINTPSTAFWQYVYTLNPGWYGPQTGWWYYTWGCTGTFAPNDYAWLASGEIARISNVWYNVYLWGWWGPYHVLQFNNNNPFAPWWPNNLLGNRNPMMWTWNQNARKIQKGLVLNCELQYDFGTGTFVEAIGFNPGDFIYYQNPTTNNVVEGNIRYTDIDGHQIAGYRMGQGAWEDDALVMAEVFFADPNDPRYQKMIKNSEWGRANANAPITASTNATLDTAYGQCMPTYDLSVECDFWQGERVWEFNNTTQQWENKWKGIPVAATAVALRSPNPDVQPQHERIAKSTVLDTNGQEFFVHTTTIHNVTPDYREYLGLEIFLDNGFDNSLNTNPANLNPKPLDLHDNYIRGSVCEPYFGATDRGIDLDYGRPLTALAGSIDNPKFFDMDGGFVFGCNEPIYFDIDNSDSVTVNDIRVTPVKSVTGPNNAAIPITYLSGSKVTQGDSDISRPLTVFGPNIKYFDSYHPISRLPSGKYDYGESIYYDVPEPPTYPTGNGYVSASDMRYSEVKIGPVVYHCGEKVGIGDAFTFQYPLYMISLGKNGDYNYMDFPVLPFPTMDVDIQIDKTLKVEQTSKITVSVKPPPKPGESIFVSLVETKLDSRLPTMERMFYRAERVAGNWLEPNVDYTCDGTITNTHFDHPWLGYGYWPYYYYGNGNQHYVTLPWTFRFYGTDYTTVNVQMTGTIGFGPGSNHYNINANPYNYYDTNGYGYYGECALRLNSIGAPRATALGYFWRLNECCWGDGIWPASGETVFIITWKGSYGPTLYMSFNPPFPEDLVCQMILFQSGKILMQYKKTNCPPYFYGQYMVPGATSYEVGLSSGNGVDFTQYGDNGTCGWGSEGNVMFTPTVVPAVPGVPAITPGEDLKFINPENPVANFEFTPYRGTCLEDGTRAPVEINLYRDSGGYDDPVPRNPPPKTFMAYREPSYSIFAPNWNGKVIAVQSVFGYLPGDWILIGNSYNIERRQITEVHVGDEGANTVQSYHSFLSSSTLLSKIVPVEDVSGFSIGHTVIIGDNVERHATPNGPYIQETHIIANVYQIPNPPAPYARLTSQASIGTNISFNVTSAANYNVGDYIGFGSTNNWWDQTPKRGVETARIISINGNTITVDILHTTIPTNYYIHQVNAIETRDPLKFDHYGPGDEPAGSNRTGKGCPVFNTTFSFSLNTGLNYDHGFGEPVVGVLYFDPYYITNKWSRFDLDMYPVRSFADMLPANIMSPDLDNGYDCFYRGRYNIEPEDIDIQLYRKCLKVGQLEQRFPNVLVKLWDADNPNDVNDPANIPISCPAGLTGIDQTIIANVNASGAGVAYLMTCDGFTIGNEPPLGPVTHRFIVQVNTDGSYDWWRWYEPNTATQIYDALDSSDWLYRWLDDDPDNVINPPIRTSIPQNDQQYSTMLIDNDCSIGGGICDPVNKDKMWPCLGDVTSKDAYGRFNGVVQDWAQNYPNPNNGPATPYAYGRISHFGIPCVIDRWDSSQERGMQTDGGQVMFPLVPKQPGKINIRVYTYNAIFNYNVASIEAPDGNVYGTPNPGPYFWQDLGMGIDYVGHKTIEVTPADADVNFIEMTMVDHALQNSKLNYTAGVDPLYPMKAPTPRIARDYDPIVRDWKRQVRSYPGGQTYPGILTGITKGFGWNAYPAIWEKQFVKLGTEFYPLADYGLYFILADGTGNHIGVGIPQTPAPANYRDTNQEPELCIDKIRVTGPFMTPMYWNPANLNCIIGTRTTPSYQYNNIMGLPIAYDYSGEIEANNNNYPAYFSFFGGDFTNRWNPLSVDAYTYEEVNTWLAKWKDLYYGNFWYVNQTYPNPNHQAGAPAASPNPVEDQQSAIWVFDALIPISSGEINIEVELENGVKKTYEDCCESAVSGRLRNIPVHGLKIDGAPISVTVDTDNVFDLTVTEDTGVDILDNHEWKNKECNDALVFAWQDKGTIDPSSKLMKGTLDGWITLPPQSSATTKVEHAYAKAEDANGDGKISYRDDETEILGSYDLATNTWMGGFIDARTYQRNDGKYRLALTDEAGAQIKVVGVDIAGRDANGRPLPRDITDHIIDTTEETPIIVTAYKYGDDNQDRGFTPLYDQSSKYDFSHEVYLSGQIQIPIDAVRDLNVTFSPEPLTAGVVSELMSNTDPLTFAVTDFDGKPIDLSIGVPDANGNRQVIDRSVWYYLFVDPHPDDYLYYGKNAVLPQYYWMRTDLHNQQTRTGNYGYNNYNYFSSWNPIDFFPNYAEGKYAFKGFIANDKGEFEVYVYTPDRKHSGVVKVKVANPKIRYEIKNMEKKENIYSTPGSFGDPDFILTGNDNRTYEITVACSNAQDALLKGVARTVSVCSGEGRDIARYTPAITVPRNYYAGINYPVYMGVDLNGDKKFTQISATQIEYTTFGTIGGFPYNTFNRRFSDGSYGGTDGWYTSSWYPGFQGYLFPAGWGYPDFASSPRTFGLSCIYNDIYDGTYYFADITPDGRLNYRDSLSLDEKGRTTFYLFATDAFNVTGLVGYNEYTNTRYAASAVNFFGFQGRPFGPNYLRYRYMGGGPSIPYYMNWEAWPDTQLKSRIPVVKVLDPVTEEEWQKSVYEPNNYDLVYGMRNHMLVRVYPADSRDIPVHEDATILFGSNDPTNSQRSWPSHERMVAGRLTKGKDDPNVRETNIFVEPTGTGKGVAGLTWLEMYNNSRGGQSAPWNQIIFGTTFFDVVKGMEIIPEVPENLKTGRETSLTIKVVIAGESPEPVEGAKVTIGGIVAEQNGTTNAKGEVTFKVKPTDAGRIKITATHDTYGKSTHQLGVDIEVAPPLLIVDPIPSYTNKDSITVKGTTTPGSTVKIGGKPATVDKDGKFTAQVSLTEGLNQFDIDSYNPAGLSTSLTLSIIRDTVAPEIIIDQKDPNFKLLLINGQIMLTGRVEPYSTVTVNGAKASVVYDIWTAVVSMTTTGDVNIDVEAVDPAGNSTKKTFQIEVWNQDILDVSINAVNMTVNGNPVNSLPRSVKLENGVVMVPAELFTTLFKEAAPTIDSAAKTATFRIAGKDVVVKENSKDVTFGTETLTIGNAVKVDLGVYYLDASSFSQMFGVALEYNQATGTVKFTRLYK